MPEPLSDSVWESIDQFQNYCADNAEESGWDELPKRAQAHLEELSKTDPELAGFFDAGIDAQDMLLIVTEVSEALEERRNGRAMDEEYLNGAPGKENKPEGVPSEMADVMIRVAHVMRRKGVRLSKTLKGKLEFNATRGFRHGGRKF